MVYFKVKHDKNYDELMTDNFMKSLDAIDSTMPAMIEVLLDLKVPS